MKTHGCQIFLFLIVFILSSFSACEEPDPTILPAETQSGKNTFGCYVNNELFVGGFANLMGPKAFNASYSKINNGIGIMVSGVLNSNFKTGRDIFIEVLSIKTDSTMQINNVFCYNMNEFYPYFVANKSGEIYITKLDTINKIVSGRFKFTAMSADWKRNLVDNDSIVVSNGRFDLELEIIN